MSDTGSADGVEASRVRLTEQEAQLNLRTMLELCAAGQVRCSEKTSRPSAATIRAVDAHLVHGDFYDDDPIASFAWPLLLQAGSLAKIDGGRLRLTPKGRAALQQPSADGIRQLWQRWLTHAVIDEFSRIEEIKGQRVSNVLTAAKARRQIVGTALASSPPHEWIDVDALFTRMRRENMSPTIARSEMALWKLYLMDAQYGSLGYDGFHRWELLEGRYTLAVLFEYAGTLGLLDLDYVDPVGARDDFQDNWGWDDMDALSRYDGLRSIRLNALGSYAAGQTDEYRPPAATESGHVLKVLPSLDVVATGIVSSAEQLLLTAYAEHTADRVWTISAASLLTAIDNDRDLTELTAFLTQRTEHELPQALTTLIGDVTQRATQLTDLGHPSLVCVSLQRRLAVRAQRLPLGLEEPRGQAGRRDGAVSARPARPALGFRLLERLLHPPLQRRSAAGGLPGRRQGDRQRVRVDALWPQHRRAAPRPFLDQDSAVLAAGHAGSRRCGGSVRRRHGVPGVSERDQLPPLAQPGGRDDRAGVRASNSQDLWMKIF